MPDVTYSSTAMRAAARLAFSTGESGEGATLAARARPDDFDTLGEAAAENVHAEVARTSAAAPREASCGSRMRASDANALMFSFLHEKAATHNNSYKNTHNKGTDLSTGHDMKWTFLQRQSYM